MNYYTELDNDFSELDEPQDVTCMHCGKNGFHWDKTGTGWRLFDEVGDMHSCRKTGVK